MAVSARALPAYAERMIASPAAGYMTGAKIRVDGGQVQGMN